MYKLVTDGIDIMYNSNSIEWNSSEDTLGVQMTFNSIKNLYEGQVVSLFWNDDERIRGVIVKKKPNRWTYTYTVQDYSRYFKNKKLFQFNGECASDAITSIASGAYVVCNICNIPTKIIQIYKGKTYSDVIDDILDKATKNQGIEYFKEIIANVLYVRQLQDMKINPNLLLPKEIEPESSIEDMKNKIEVIVNKEDDNNIYASAEDTSKQDYYGVLSEQIEVEDENIAQAKNIADNTLNKYNKIIKSCSINDIAVLSEDYDIRAYRLIYLNAGSRLCGYYEIKSARHTLNNGIHKVSLDIEWRVDA